MGAAPVKKMGDIEAAGGPKTEIEKKQAYTSQFQAFIEHYFNQFNKVPSIERLRCDFPEYSDSEVKKNLEAALIKLEIKGYNLTKREYLTPTQLAVANSMLNLEDKRSTTRKLQDFGVSAATYSNWKKDPSYNAYLRERSEGLLGNSVGEVHLALIDSARSGDISAIKLFYEITGRHTPGSQQVANVKTMLIQVIEAVQRHVTDPALLQRIANDLQLSTGGMLQGELMPNQSERGED